MSTMTTTLVRPLPWDVMGSRLEPDNAHDYEGSLLAAGLNYTVRTQPLYIQEGSVDAGPYGQVVSYQEVPKHQAVTRTTPDGPPKTLGVVGARYTPIQNVDAFAIASDLVTEEYGASIVGLADFRGGGASLLALDLGRPIDLQQPDGGTDRVDLYLLGHNDHRGNAALTYALTPIRPRCTNAVQAALAHARMSWRVSHTPRAQDRVEEARRAMLTAVSYRDRFQVEAQQLMDARMSQQEFWGLVKRLVPVDDEVKGKVAERKQAKREDLYRLWQTSPALDGVRMTRWGGYNAVTEYLDHMRPVRGAQQAVARAEAAVYGPLVKQKRELWDTFASM